MCVYKCTRVLQQCELSCLSPRWCVRWACSRCRSGRSRTPRDCCRTGSAATSHPPEGSAAPLLTSATPSSAPASRSTRHGSPPRAAAPLALVAPPFWAGTPFPCITMATEWEELEQGAGLEQEAMKTGAVEALSFAISSLGR